ncbi:MAG: GNAT family N-acetyltransferase [Oscillospiraceae bacterium]|nr:GNAT family N-acetyltransferase [Oscillospiraceae bacterium]
MEISRLDDRFREQVDRHIKEEWLGPMIVSRGNVFDSSTLPGLIAEEDGSLLGALLYRAEQGECEIAILFSLKENQGTATSLIDVMLKDARTMGIRRVWLVTTNDNAHAIRFYLRRGFSLKDVHIGGFEPAKRLKFGGVTPLGNDGIPILHEFEFEMLLS